MQRLFLLSAISPIFAMNCRLCNEVTPGFGCDEFYYGSCCTRPQDDCKRCKSIWNRKRDVFTMKCVLTADSERHPANDCYKPVVDLDEWHWLCEGELCNNDTNRDSFRIEIQRLEIIATVKRKLKEQRCRAEATTPPNDESEEDLEGNFGWRNVGPVGILICCVYFQRVSNG